LGTIREPDNPAGPTACLVTLRASDSPARFLIHDRDGKFTRAFDGFFESEGVEVIRTPFRAPQANAFAERWAGTVRRDCLDWLLISSCRQFRTQHRQRSSRIARFAADCVRRDRTRFDLHARSVWSWDGHCRWGLGQLAVQRISAPLGRGSSSSTA
jgi:hypothetical protein